jgi:hypothetical protein
MKRTSSLWVIALTGASLGVGCASTLPPASDQWSAAQADVGRAEAGGAPQVPEARLHLQLAQEDLQKTKQLMGQDDKRAGSLTALASAEAQLALSLAKQSAAQEQAQKALGDLQKATLR